MKSLFLAAMVGLLATAAFAQHVLVNEDLNALEQTLVGKSTDSAHGAIRIGARVITRRGFEGAVAGVNPQTNAIKVRFSDGTVSEEKLANLASTEGCNGVFCVGENVTARSYYSATIIGIFGDGMIAVKYFDGSVGVLNPAELSL